MPFLRWPTSGILPISIFHFQFPFHLPISISPSIFHFLFSVFHFPFLTTARSTDCVATIVFTLVFSLAGHFADL